MFNIRTKIKLLNCSSSKACLESLADRVEPPMVIFGMYKEFMYFTVHRSARNSNTVLFGKHGFFNSKWFYAP
jgi:hypothetical protein